MLHVETNKITYRRWGDDVDVSCERELKSFILNNYSKLSVCGIFCKLFLISLHFRQSFDFIVKVNFQYASLFCYRLSS